MSFRTGFLVRNPVFGKRRSLASGAHWARDDKSLNHQNLPDTAVVPPHVKFAKLAWPNFFPHFFRSQLSHLYFIACSTH